MNTSAMGLNPERSISLFFVFLNKVESDFVRNQDVSLIGICGHYYDLDMWYSDAGSENYPWCTYAFLLISGLVGMLKVGLL